jgi:hypothetical protein
MVRNRPQPLRLLALQLQQQNESLSFLWYILMEGLIHYYVTNVFYFMLQVMGKVAMQTSVSTALLAPGQYHYQNKRPYASQPKPSVFMPTT